MARAAQQIRYAEPMRSFPNGLFACLSTWLVVWMLSASPGIAGTGEPDDAPNLLIVVTDDQRFDQLGCAGHPVLRTPAADALAAKGLRFTNSFVTTPICAASRASLMTARWEGSHGYTFGTPPMGAAIADDTYFAQLREAGYRTSFVGKWGVRFDQGERAKLFDGFAGMRPPYLRAEAKHLTERTADAAIGQLPQDASEGPFCLTLSFNSPHAEDAHPHQFIPMPELSAMYEEVDVPEPPLAIEGFEVLPEFLKSSLGRERWGWRFDSREKQVRRTRDYWSMISGMDLALGRVLKALEERGLAENTVVIFTSDNGFFLGERGLAGKWFIYEESIRVPLIIYDPRAPKAARGVDRSPYVLNVDLAPTLLELAGVAQPDSYEGRSLVPFINGETPDWRRDFLVEHRFDHPKIPKSVGLRGERWVYALYDEQEPVFEQLFDLKTDPAQLRDLARDPSFEAVLTEQRARCATLRGSAEARLR